MQVLSPVYCKMEIKLMAMQPSACKKNYKKNLKLTIKKIKRQVKGHLKCESQLMHTTNILFVFRRSWTGKRWKSYSWSILLAHIIFFYQRKRPVSSSTEYTAGWLPLSPRAILASLLAVCIDIYFGYPSLKTTAWSYISPNKLLFPSDLKVKDGGRTASFQH